MNPIFIYLINGVIGIFIGLIIGKKIGTTYKKMENSYEDLLNKYRENADIYRQSNKIISGLNNWFNDFQMLLIQESGISKEKLMKIMKIVNKKYGIKTMTSEQFEEQLLKMYEDSGLSKHEFFEKTGINIDDIIDIKNSRQKDIVKEKQEFNIDDILDQISKKGKESLTKEQLDFLNHQKK